MPTVNNLMKRQIEIKIIGLLPNLSLKLPINGANKNWVMAYAKVNQPPYLAASLMSP